MAKAILEEVYHIRIFYLKMTKVISEEDIITMTQTRTGTKN